VNRWEQRSLGNDVKRQVTIAQGTKTIILTINSNKVLVNGKTVTIDVPAKDHQ